MLKDVIFNDDKSALDDFGLVLTKSEITLPAPKTYIVDIAGADGVLDLSEVLTGEIQYENRTLKLTFEVLSDYEFEYVITELSNYLHGKRLKIQITDTDFYYVGRCVINSWQCVKRKGTVVVLCDVEPYKYSESITVINRVLSGQQVLLNLLNDRKRVCPIIKANGNITVTKDGVNYTLTNGEQSFIGFILTEGDNYVTLNGNGTVTFTYQKGAL